MVGNADLRSLRNRIGAEELTVVARFIGRWKQGAPAMNRRTTRD